MDTDKFAAIFSGLLLDALDHTKSHDYTRQEATYLERVLVLPQAGKVLDVPCGSGRLMLELAARGYQMTGIDIAQPSVDELCRRAQERNLVIAAEQGDMRDLRWNTEFDGAYCAWESFGYFDDAGNLDFLKAVYRALKPGARFLIDTHVVESFLPHFPHRFWSQSGDLLVLEEADYDLDRGRFSREWVFIRGEQQEKRSLSLRLYTYRELCGLLTEAGFTDLKGYNLLSVEKFAVGGPRLNIIARKAKSPRT
jgi:SAM-dependent methyltransferase